MVELCKYVNSTQSSISNSSDSLWAYRNPPDLVWQFFLQEFSWGGDLLFWCRRRYIWALETLEHVRFEHSGPAPMHCRCPILERFYLSSVFSYRVWDRSCPSASGFRNREQLVLLGRVLNYIRAQDHLNLLELVREILLELFLSDSYTSIRFLLPDPFLLLFFDHMTVPSLETESVEYLSHEWVDRRIWWFQRAGERLPALQVLVLVLLS